MNTVLSDLSSTQPRKWYHDWAEKLKGIGGGGPNALKYQNPPRLAEDAILTNILFPYFIFVIFFTRAKFLDNKIYTEKRQFFTLNL